MIVEVQFRSLEFDQVLAMLPKTRNNIILVEAKVFGFNHLEVGQIVLRDWQLPEDLVLATVCHHNPVGAEGEFMQTANILFLSDYICQKRGIGYADVPGLNQYAFQKSLNRLGLQTRAIELIVAEVEEEIGRMEAQGWFI